MSCPIANCENGTVIVRDKEGNIKVAYQCTYCKQVEDAKKGKG